MGFSEVYTQWKLVTARHKPMEKRKRIVAAAARTLALRRAIAGRVSGNESVEVYMYHEAALRKPLNLLTTCRTKSWGSFSQLSNSDLIGTVMDTWQPMVMEVLDGHPYIFAEYPARLPAARLDALQAAREGHEAMFEKGELTAAKYAARMRQCQSEYDEALRACKAAWIREHFGIQ